MSSHAARDPRTTYFHDGLRHPLSHATTLSAARGVRTVSLIDRGTKVLASEQPSEALARLAVYDGDSGEEVRPPLVLERGRAAPSVLGVTGDPDRIVVDDVDADGFAHLLHLDLSDAAAVGAPIALPDVRFRPHLLIGGRRQHYRPAVVAPVASDSGKAVALAVQARMPGQPHLGALLEVGLVSGDYVRAPIQTDRLGRGDTGRTSVDAEDVAGVQLPQSTSILRFVTGSRTGWIRLWSNSTPERMADRSLSLPASISRHQFTADCSVGAMAARPDGALLAVGTYAGSIHVLDVGGHTADWGAERLDPLISPEWTYVSREDHAKAWHPLTAAASPSAVTALSFCGSERIVAGHQDGALRLWDTKTGTLLAERDRAAQPGPVAQLLPLAGETTVVWRSGGSIGVWHLPPMRAADPRP